MRKAANALIRGGYKFQNLAHLKVEKFVFPIAAYIVMLTPN